MVVTKRYKIHRPPLKRQRVAAYARVSSGKDEQLHSIAAQINYYKTKITHNPAWAFAGIFADEDATGTKRERLEFDQLLNYCRQGQVDLILTKAISRFARNTVDLLGVIRELKELGVAVEFERENINTLSADGELMLTLLASFAQEESYSASENMKWAIRKGYEQGSLMQIRRTYGYSVTRGVITVIPEEAEIVRELFENYAAGVKAKDILQSLNERRVKTLSGQPWCRSRLNQILSNVFYTGTAQLQKLHVPNHLTKKQERNKGEIPRYFVDDSHEAIVSEELFEEVRRIREGRRIEKPVRAPSVLDGKVRCGLCGDDYHRRRTRDQHKWICRTYKSEGTKRCPSKQVPEYILMEVSAELLGLSSFKEEVLEEAVVSITVFNGQRLVFSLKDGTKREQYWKAPSRSESWTDEMRQSCGFKTKLRWEKKHAQG